MSISTHFHSHIATIMARIVLSINRVNAVNSRRPFIRPTGSVHLAWVEANAGAAWILNSERHSTPEIDGERTLNGNHPSVHAAYAQFCNEITAPLACALQWTHYSTEILNLYPQLDFLIAQVCIKWFLGNFGSRFVYSVWVFTEMYQFWFDFHFYFFSGELFNVFIN